MKKFEVGKKYLLHGAMVKRSIEVIKRTNNYVAVTGDYSGRLLVRSGCFGDFEFLWVPVVVGDNGYKMQVLCFARNEI